MNKRAKKWGVMSVVILGAAMVYGNGKEALSVFRGISIQPEGVSITWESDAIETQVVERAESLAEPQDWQPIFTNIPAGAPFTNVYVDDHAPNVPALFYRLAPPQ